ncbi:hypothetical protein MITS9509_01361 [Synechococcus sp. MIT S9509]|uniref:hypothetical protein n=1 Tax=Synechococcus sp. MIT S9509 TaxID=1801630 RepID=UPI0007BBEADC|nr:hypothetical protein [Synechococcus sp. MIT S9509]KZR92374.1 hypothetical protein MITS9509_01361 [Synechococcus sp. MIT S9509]
MSKPRHGWSTPAKARAVSQAQIRRIETEKRADQRHQDTAELNRWIDHAKEQRAARERRAERVNEIRQNRQAKRDVLRRYG